MKKFDFLNIAVDEEDIDVFINGEIVSDNIKELYAFFGVNNVTAPGGFKQILNENKGKNLTIHINSIGGDVFAGVEMYNAIIEFKGNTTAVVDSIAASAATLPMVACKSVKMTASSVVMIHCASMSWTGGNAQDLQKDVNALQTIDNAIANAYQIKTSKSHQELLKMMQDETWMDCKQAKELGFVDIIDSRLLPDAVVNDVLNSKKAMVAILRDLPKRNQYYKNIEEESKKARKQNLLEEQNTLAEFEFLSTIISKKI